MERQASLHTAIASSRRVVRRDDCWNIVFPVIDRAVIDEDPCRFGSTGLFSNSYRKNSSACDSAYATVALELCALHTDSASVSPVVPPDGFRTR